MGGDIAGLVHIPSTASWRGASTSCRDRALATICKGGKRSGLAGCSAGCSGRRASTRSTSPAAASRGTWTRRGGRLVRRGSRVGVLLARVRLGRGGRPRPPRPSGHLLLLSAAEGGTRDTGSGASKLEWCSVAPPSPRSAQPVSRCRSRRGRAKSQTFRPSAARPRCPCRRGRRGRLRDAWRRSWLLALALRYDFRVCQKRLGPGALEQGGRTQPGPRPDRRVPSPDPDGGRRRWAAARSLAKSLGPDLRLAILAGDPHTISRVRGRQAVGPGWVSHLLQCTAATLWADPKIARDLKKATATYSQRREAFIAALADHGIEAEAPAA